MEHRITVRLSSAGIQDAIRQITEYKEWLERKTAELSQALADIGLKTAQVTAAGASFEYFYRARSQGAKDAGQKWEHLTVPADITVSAVPTERGYRIEANGHDVCFVEFGTGVYYNGDESYPGQRPPGIVGIGEFGQGLGKNRYWNIGGGVYTNGFPALAPMFEASYEMRGRIADIAREVFSS